MQINRNNSFSLLGLATATALLTACGGGGGSSATLGAGPLSGKAVDFYLSGATVTFTGCNNQTTTTNATGNFTAPAGCAQSAITVTGGTDIGTGLAFTGTLKSPTQSVLSAQNVVVSPITTLLASSSLTSAQIDALLGLPAGYDPLTSDPLLNAQALKASLIVQTLLDKVAQALLSTSTANGGTLTAQQASQDAIQALASSLAASSTSSAFDLTNSTNIQAIVTSAATSAGTALNLPSGMTAASLATTVTPGISTQVSAVSAAVANIVIGATPAATLAALTAGGVTTAVGNAQSSTSATLTNYVQLGNVSFNGGSATTLAAVQASTTASPISLSGAALNDIQISLTGVGTYANKTVPVNAGFKYAIGTNVVNVIINNVQLTFNSSGALTAATVPAGASYTFTLAGASTASATLTNSTADNLFSNGGVDLSIPTFLTKLSGAASLSTTALAAYTPTANTAISSTLVIGAGSNTALVVGNAAGQAVAVTSISAGTSTVSGSGVTANVK